MPGRRAGFGRAKGTPNKVTKLVRTIAQEITLGNEVVVARLMAQAESGTIEPAVFNKLLEYGYGKPKQEIEITTPESPAVALARAFYESLSPEDRKTALDFARRRRALAESTVVDVTPNGNG
jgi:hypothetical protein